MRHFLRAEIERLEELLHMLQGAASQAQTAAAGFKFSPGNPTPGAIDPISQARIVTSVSY